jgi:hypothetical protein
MVIPTPMNFADLPLSASKSATPTVSSLDSRPKWRMDV